MSERMTSVEERGHRSARSVALRLALLYAIVAGLWVTFSDRALTGLGLPVDAERFVSATKGQAFVIVTAIGLYVLAKRHLQRLYSSEERHRRLFHNSPEGLMVFRVGGSQSGIPGEIVIEDVNATQTVRLHRTERQLIGKRRSDSSDARLKPYFDIVHEASEARQALHRELRLEAEGVDEMLTTFAIEEDLYVLTCMDVSDLRAAQKAIRSQEEWIRDAYVDVLAAVTGGKLLLLTERELDAELGTPLLPIKPIESTGALAEARGEVRAAVGQVYPGLADSMELLNPFGEALNNVLKHAGSGQYGAFVNGERVQLYVGDHGPGIDFRTLPRAALVAGFSTTATLGLGFSIMLQLCDRVMISTKPGRTIVVLEVSAAASAPRLAGIAESVRAGTASA